MGAGRIWPLTLPGLLAACGAGANGETSIDTSVGLNARPDNPHCIGAGFPRALSDQACFEGQPPAASSALVPYSVNAPLWSDGADKTRYLALPAGAALQVQRDGSFELPPGGVLIKEFAVGTTRLETRFLARDVAGQWHAATYIWNEAQTDALLELEGARVEHSDHEDEEEREDEDEREGEDEHEEELAWTVPSQEQCFECHTEAAGVSLGLEQRQMALSMEYPATRRVADQIHTLTELGLLEGESEHDPLVSFLDTDANLEARARAYLHANCAHCHRPGGMGEGQMDLRASTPLRLTGTCGERPLTADPVPGGGLILAPGDPERSGLYVRMAERDPTWRMPPVGSDMVDVSGSRLVFDWIASLEACP